MKTWRVMITVNAPTEASAKQLAEFIREQVEVTGSITISRLEAVEVTKNEA